MAEEGPPQLLPPLPAVAAALRAITERLARELAEPECVAPEWSDFEWRIARAVAAIHGISGLLARRLLWQGAHGWAQFLRHQHEQIAGRQRRIQELLGTVDERFERAGIPVQALKGAALHLAGFYQPGERPMADLDLLTPPQYIERAAQILETLGLHESHRTFKQRIEVFRPEQPRGAWYTQ